MLLIALLHNIQGAMKNYATRRQLAHLSHFQLKDVAITRENAQKEVKKANVISFLKESFKRRSEREEP
ncbi:hypothetical protein MED121_14724 [Marinomonas sp. MED121]|uniref:DUF1127 domain-containing protein n=1 Tax=Marinomonas sp. MED121 TaxID=314277 RepID=UPI0000690F7E|nr:DUF1127 domain-containing protein [Marinomonas sp. MED121]EAQ67190.1 hypothetical protein MED121_14724 [Marinomonas sp. MED121]